jgi:hypothetical protein
MDLEQLYVFNVGSPLTAEKRRALDVHFAENATIFEREAIYKWLKRGDEKFVRIVVDPVTIEMVFFDDRIECYGAAPAWARLLFTKARREELKNRIESMLAGAGFMSEDAA